MSILPNRTEASGQRRHVTARHVVLAVVIGLLLVYYFRTRSATYEAPPPAPTSVASPASVNPILSKIGPQAGVTRAEGIGVAVLVDTTGSMSNSVADAGGYSRPKLEIARRAVLALLDTTDHAARAAPDRNIRVGVYEFSDRTGMDDCRRMIPLGPLDLAAARSAVSRLTPNGGTPIGNAMIVALQDLAASGLAHQHVLIVTDGENNKGYLPADVMNAVGQLPEESRPAVYFVAFDIAAERFRPLRDAGAMVLAASNGTELQQTLDYILTGKILAEQPSAGTP